MPGVNYTCELQELCLRRDGDRLPSAVIGLKAYLYTQKEKHLSQEKAAATDTSNCVRLEKWIFRFVVHSWSSVAQRRENARSSNAPWSS